MVIRYMGLDIFQIFLIIVVSILNIFVRVIAIGCLIKFLFSRKSLSLHPIIYILVIYST